MLPYIGKSSSWLGPTRQQEFHLLMHSLAECDSRIAWSPRSFWIGMRTDQPVEPAGPSFHPFGQNHGTCIIIFRDGFKPPVFLFRRLNETISTGSFDLNYNDLEAITAFERSPRLFVIFPNGKQIYYAGRLLSRRSRKSDELPASHRLCALPAWSQGQARVQVALLYRSQSVASMRKRRHS